MSKRVLILLAAGILAIVAAVFLLKYELTAKEPEEEPEEEEEEEQESGQEKFSGFKKGFKWDSKLKKYIPVTPKQETEKQPDAISTPVPDSLIPG